jgi:nicotinic acid phosphoribosyltransferase
MSSHGGAARNVNIASGGTMGHRFTQRFARDEEAFRVAIERVLAYRKEKSVQGKSKLSFLLDTRNTLKQGLPAALKVIQAYREEIREQIQLSIRFYSGDLETQLKAAIAMIKACLPDALDWPDIIMESGLTAKDVARFEAIAEYAGYPRRKLLYGVGGYLIGNINRDQISMVYKLTSYNGVATMKFGDEDEEGKASYPGRFTLMERVSKARIERCVVHMDDVSVFAERGWSDVFIDLVKDGVLVARPVSKELMQQWISLRWDQLAKGYIGEEKYPANFAKRPRLSAGIQELISTLRAQQFQEDEIQTADVFNSLSDNMSLINEVA